MVVGFDFSRYVFIFSVFFLSFSESKGTGFPLSEYIRYFEPLFYDHQHLQEQQRRSSMDHHFPVEFTAHNRFFRLRLKRDASVFADDTEFYSTKNTVLYDTSRALTGYLEGNEDSSVEAVITVSGLLDGVIKVGDDEFYIEPAKNYLQTTQHFHSVIYKLSDVNFPKKNLSCLSHRMKLYKNDLHFLFAKAKTAKYKNYLKSSKQHEVKHSKFENKLSYKSRLQLKIRHENSKQNVRLPRIPNVHHHNHHHHHYSASIPKYHYSQRTKPKSFHTIIIAKNFTNARTSGRGLDVTMPILYKTFLSKRKLKNHKLFTNSTINLRTKIMSSTVSSASKNTSTLLTKKLISAYFKSSHSTKSAGFFLDFKNDTMYSGSSDVNHDEDSHEDYNRMMTNCSACIHNFSPIMNTGLSEKEGSHTNIKDHVTIREDIFQKQELPYWRELDALHYTEEGRIGSSEPYGVRSIQRTQWTEDRGQRHIAVDRRKSTCLLYLQADHLFYQKMGSEEACIEAMTRHVQRVNSIYRSTDFDQDGRPDNISFLIKRIKVHTSPDHSDYRFVGNYGVEQFLELFSEDDYDAFCLAYMFTYRDFEGGTLGLAWTGDLKNAGGVCEKNGHYRGSLKSLNTGIITLLNYGKHVPPVVSHVTLAHEIGHNFGSPHDPEDDQHCTPGDEHGNYIMFARATSGDKKNNNKFSPCSLRSINAVLNTKARSVKGCFTEPLDAVCGNEVVEGAEECDCGWEEDCHEPCCFPMRVNPPQDQPPCRLRPAAFCSPSQGPCCSRDCRLKYGVICREDNGCRTASFCDGQGPQCPPSTKKPNKTVCSEEFVCYNGECTGSICMAYGLESCQCIRTIHDPLIRSCELCCKLPGDELSCKSSFEWNVAPYDVPDLYAKPGAPCDNYNGYCDVYQSCREIDPSGPLATLRKLLLSPEGAVILRRWLAEKWWGILLLFLAVTLTVVISLRLISRGHTKNFLSTILPHQRSDFRLCHGRPSTRSHPTYLVTSKSRTTNMSRPRISSAPENGWV